MIIITFGEMVNMPISQSIAARFAPEDKRARYMAVFGFSWTVPMLFGIIITGWIYDTSIVRSDISDNLLWYITGIIAIIAVAGFLLLHRIARNRFAAKMESVSDD
jgi:MFS family permease